MDFLEIIVPLASSSHREAATSLAEATAEKRRRTGVSKNSRHKEKEQAALDLKLEGHETRPHGFTPKEVTACRRYMEEAESTLLALQYLFEDITSAEHDPGPTKRTRFMDRLLGITASMRKIKKISLEVHEEEILFSRVERVVTSIESFGSSNTDRSALKGLVRRVTESWFTPSMLKKIPVLNKYTAVAKGQEIRRSNLKPDGTFRTTDKMSSDHLQEILQGNNPRAARQARRVLINVVSNASRRT